MEGGGASHLAAAAAIAKLGAQATAALGTLSIISAGTLLALFAVKPWWLLIEPLATFLLIDNLAANIVRKMVKAFTNELFFMILIRGHLVLEIWIYL
ncbi:hypothetical protein ACJX0J_004229, partial [Zea mays]